MLESPLQGEARPLRTPQVRAAIVSVAAGLGILAFKFAAYLVTGSVAILSDAAESVVNVVAAARRGSDASKRERASEG